MASDREKTAADLEGSVYTQLHEIAERALARETPGHSLQPTLLANDAYMRLLDQRNIDPEQRSAVLAAGAKIVRRLLVDYARKRRALRRGGVAGRGVPLEIFVGDEKSPVDLLELHEALDNLSRKSERLAEVVELRFFGGLTQEEIAKHIGVSDRTIRNDWNFAKAWLYDALSDE